jgi:hypothetical protein
MASVKWLDRIEAVAEPFQGYQMVRAYRYAQTADGPGEAVNVIRARRPDDSSRHSRLHEPANRLVDAGPLLSRESVGRASRRIACRG